MLLSYSLRLLCLTLLGIGCTQAIFELAFWLASPRLLKMLSGAGARRQEQILFGGQITTHALAFLLTVLLLVPRYVAAETNLFAERVGYLSLTAAGLFLSRYLYSLKHGLSMWWRAAQLQRACRHTNTIDGVWIARQPEKSIPGSYPPLALVGLLRPRILIAETALEISKLSAEALSIALDHERAHLRHRDNWKLFALACLPRLGLHTIARPGCLRLWQRYNDWAADDDAVKGSRLRALTLAESLVACAKSIPVDRPDLLFTGFATHEDELSARIDRLLGFGTPPPRAANRQVSALVVCAAAIVVAAGSFLFAIAASLHEVAESILHFG
jgi:beta-lactamase regulating signal transducer with metallopeptidase domain